MVEVAVVCVFCGSCHCRCQTVSNWCCVGSWARALPFQAEEGVCRSSWGWIVFAFAFVSVVIVFVVVFAPSRSVSLSYPYTFPWNSSSVKAGRANPPAVDVYVSYSRKACAPGADTDPELGAPCGVVFVDRSLLVCVFGREDGPAGLLLVLDARVLARSELGRNALFARPVAEVWMRVASEGGAGGWLEGVFEVEGNGAGAGVLLWVWLMLGLGLPRMFSWLVMALGLLGLELGI